MRFKEFMQETETWGKSHKQKYEEACHFFFIFKCTTTKGIRKSYPAIIFCEKICNSGLMPCHKLLKYIAETHSFGQMLLGAFGPNHCA